jgi:hypothetical protein
MSVLGQKAKYSLGVDVFRFTPESGLMSAPGDKAGRVKKTRQRELTGFDCVK